MSSSEVGQLDIQCPKCGQRLKAPRSAAGKRLNCPKCSQQVKVPGVAANAGDDDDWLDLDAPAPQTPRKPATPQPASTSASGTASAKNSSTSNPPSAPVAPRAPASTPAAGSSPTRPTQATKVVAPVVGKSTSSNSSPSPSLSGPISSTPAALGKSVSGPAATPSLSGGKSPPVSPPIDDDEELPALAPPEDLPAKGSFLGDDLLNQWANTGGDFSVDLATIQPLSEDDLPSLNAQDPLDFVDYRIVCKTCGTPQYVTRVKAGKTLKCPDCFSSFTCPPPPADLKVDPRVLPTKKKSQGDEVVLAEAANVAPKRTDLHVKSAQQYLKDAEDEMVEKKLDDLYSVADFDTKGFMTKTFGFLTDPGVWIFAMGLGLCFAFTFGVLSFSTGGALASAQFQMVKFGFGFAVVTLLLMATFACGTALVEASSNGRTKVENWPLLSPADWFSESLPVVLASFLAAGPGALLATVLLMTSGLSFLGVMMTLATFWAFLPILLLSMLSNGSIMAPFSMEVVRSITLASDAWGAYYLKSAILMFVLFSLIALSMTNSVLAAICGAMLPITFFAVFYQLGTLGAAVAHRLTKDASDDDVDDSIPTR